MEAFPDDRAGEPGVEAARARLRDAGVIAPRREAQTIYYGIADPAAARVIALLCDIYRDKPEASNS